MSYFRSKWIPETREQTNGASYTTTYDGCGGTMKDHYEVSTVFYGSTTWGFDGSGRWVPKQTGKTPVNRQDHFRTAEPEPGKITTNQNRVTYSRMLRTV